MAKQRRYPPEFRHRVLELIRSGQSVHAVAKKLEVSRQTIMNWMRQDDLDGGRRSDGLTTGERAEFAKLQRENKRLTIENEILSKAAAWFARETNVVPKKSSDS
jgi:transposase